MTADTKVWAALTAIGLIALVASWCLEGKASEACNLAAIALFLASWGWTRAGRKGGER